MTHRSCDELWIQSRQKGRCVKTMDIWPELQLAIKSALEKESQGMKDIMEKSLKVKNLEIKTLQERILKLEYDNANADKKTKELEKFILDQDGLLLKRNQKIEKLKSQFESEEIRLKEHIFRRKLKIKELRAENDVLTENNKKLEILIKKQEETIQTQGTQREVNIEGALSLKPKSKDSEQKDVKKGHKRTKKQPVITTAPASTSTNLSSNLSDESFLERIRSKTVDTSESGRNAVSVKSYDQDLTTKRKRSPIPIIKKRSIRKRSL